MDITILTEHQMLLFLVEFFLLLLSARGLGELARRFGLPAVVGEIVAGILLGPTIFGTLLPHWQAAIFPATDALQMHMIETLSWLGALFLLMIAGMEVDLSVVRKQGRSAILIATTRIAVAFIFGAAAALLIHHVFQLQTPRLAFAAFLGIAATVCAVPVLAKILHELGMLKSDLGLLALSSSTLIDIIGWVAFTVVAGLAAGKGLDLHQPLVTAGAVLAILAFTLTLGKRLVNRAVFHIRDESRWQSGSVMVFSILLALALAIAFQKVGVHAVFGFFLAGILIGESPYVTAQTREAITEFVLSLFSPLFFASIGLKINFLTHFDLGLVTFVVVVIIVGKFLGVLIGGRLSGLSLHDALPIACGMIAGGAMEIIIALLGLQINIISQQLFVAIVIEAIVSAILAGPLLVWSLKLKRIVDLASFLPPDAIIADLHARTLRQAVTELTARVTHLTQDIDDDAIVHAVMAREAIGSTAIGEQLAIPHARLPRLDKPLLAVGRTPAGIHMDAPDNQDVHFIVLILTPISDWATQVQILAGVVGTLNHAETRQKLLACTHEEFASAIPTLFRQHKIPTAPTPS